METDKKCTLHPNGEVQLTLTPALKHYGRWDCTECGKFVVWAKSPKTCEEMIKRQKEIMLIIRKWASVEDDDSEEEFEYLIRDRDLKTLLDLYSTIHLTLVQEQTWRRLQSSYSTEDCYNARARM